MSRHTFRERITVKHGLSRTTEYTSWVGMINRCENPQCKAFPEYGGRGITVTDRWHDFTNFIADMGPKPTPRHTIERIKNDLGYSPDNCRWATRSVQAKNKRNTIFVDINGESLCLKDACDKAGVNYGTVCTRIRRGWSVENAMTLPLRKDYASRPRRKLSSL